MTGIVTGPAPPADSELLAAVRELVRVQLQPPPAPAPAPKPETGWTLFVKGLYDPRFLLALIAAIAAIGASWWAMGAKIDTQGHQIDRLSGQMQELRTTAQTQAAIATRLDTIGGQVAELRTAAQTQAAVTTRLDTLSGQVGELRTTAAAVSAENIDQRLQIVRLGDAQQVDRQNLERQMGRVVTVTERHSMEIGRLSADINRLLSQLGAQPRNQSDDAPFGPGTVVIPVRWDEITWR
jgi:hypothetical protein